MLFRRKNKRSESIKLLAGNDILYDGLLSEIPLSEETIIEYSILFFKDSNPCYIHRGAVRARLAAEIGSALRTSEEALDFMLLRKQTGLSNLDSIQFEDHVYTIS